MKLINASSISPQTFTTYSNFKNTPTLSNDYRYIFLPLYTLFAVMSQCNTCICVCGIANSSWMTLFPCCAVNSYLGIKWNTMPLHHCNWSNSGKYACFYCAVKAAHMVVSIQIIPTTSWTSQAPDPLLVILPKPVLDGFSTRLCAKPRIPNQIVPACAPPALRASSLWAKSMLPFLHYAHCMSPSVQLKPFMSIVYTTHLSFHFLLSHPELMTLPTYACVIAPLS
jgi:hypothetical protein